MQFITYLSASIISFLGLLVGVILIRIAPEEQKPLHKYFEISRQILLFLIFAFIAFYYSSSVFYISILAAYFIFSIIVEYKSQDLMKKSIIL